MDTEEERWGRVLVEGIAQRARLDLAAMADFIPAQWADRAATGFDRALGVLPETVADQVPEEIAGLLAPLTDAFERQQMSGAAALDALQAAHRLGAAAEAAVLHAARELAARTGEEQLRLKDVADPAELSRTARERWRGRCKTLTATELSVLTGMGRGTARERVAIALAPQVSRRAVDQALAAGIARMDLVAAWWRRCARMPHEQAGAVARALFATDAPPDEVAVERLTPQGQVSTAPWAKKEFYRALEREALAQEGTDPAAQERERRARHERRDAWAEVEDDGTARMVITGDAVSITAATQRVAEMAHKARRAGDQRTGAQLRSDIARMLLLHGVPALPDLGDEAALITPHDLDKLVDVLAGTPAHEVQVVVPWDTLTGTAALTGPDLNPAPGATNPGGEGPHAGGHNSPAPPGSDPPGATPPGSDPPGSTPPGSDPPGSTPPGSDPPGSALGAAPPGPSGGRVRAGVGEVLGRHGRFLSAAEVRRIAGRPGTTIYRLLTDAADGRCLERSITAYQPDAAMRAQLRAADVTSRAPGSTTAAADCQLDHVLEYLLTGPTGELNLQTLDVPFHALKTEKFWDAQMDASRTVTWTSFWGRIYRTRPHDYRQYLSRILGTHPPDQGDDPDAGGGGGGQDDPGGGQDELLQRRHLASLLVYAALAHRDPRTRLEADDDDPDTGTDTPLRALHDAVVLRRTTPTGRRTTGVRPGTPTPEDLLATDPQTVLDAQDWTDAVTHTRRPHATDHTQPSTQHPDDDPDDRATGDTPDLPPPF